jgi:hypothetical protein
MEEMKDVKEVLEEVKDEVVEEMKDVDLAPAIDENRELTDEDKKETTVEVGE